MRYLKQFSIIMTISLMGELLRELLPFLVPPSIYGLFILLMLLITGVLKVEDIKDTSSFLLDLMPIMFVPSSVGLMASWGVLQDMLIPVLVVSVIGTLVVMIVTAKATEGVVKLADRKNKEVKKDE